MKKRIFTFLTLLVAFFGLIGLTTNNYKVINAAGNQSTVNSDLAAITVPSTALISFPVTYKSVYGNDIDWTVQEGKENIIQYDEYAHWMVVNRPTEGDDEKVDITVTITGEGNATATKTFTVTVPVGVTATRSFSIRYDYGYENPVTVNNPEQYKLGQATIKLLEPAREGYMFDGWYAGEQKVEKILVGSMRDYTLTAKWTQVVIDSIYVKTNPTKTTYKALETFDASGIEVYAKYNNEEEEAIPFENLTFNKTTLHGNDTEVEVSYSGKTTTVSITVDKLDYAINEENFKDTSKEYNGQAQQIEYAGVLPEGLTATYTGSAKDVADGTVTITLSFANANEIDYNTPEDLTAKLTILPKTVTLTTAPKSIDLGAEISWTFTGGEFIEPDTISVVDLTKVTPTYKLNGQSVNPENFVTGQTYDVEFTGATADNYTVEIESSTLTINAVEVNLSAEALTYTGQEQTFVAIAKDVSGQEITGGTFTYGGNATATGTNAGTYSIEVVFTHPSHPTVTKIIDFRINPKKVTITANDVTSVYGTLPELENKWSQEGILAADSDDFVVEVTTNATATSLPGTYETTANCTSTNSNYDVVYVEGTHTVTKKQVTVTVDETTITSAYGEALATLKYKLAEENSLVEGDETAFSQLISLSTTATSNSNVGEYDITITAGESNKYDIEVAEQLPKYVITQKDLTGLVEVTVNGSDWNIQDSTSLTPEVTVKYGELTITTYGLTYEYADETTKVGQATITVEFNENYTGEAEVQFLITENGLAVEDGKLLAQKYASVLTGTLTTIEQLDVEGTNGSTVTWITDSTALSINSEGNVTITRPTGKDEEVILYAHINYGKSSEDVISFEFTVEGIYSLESTNVKIENIGSGYTLNAETIEEANLDTANFQIKENEQYVTAYDISFTQGEDTNAQPGKVTVKLAVPEEYENNEGLVIYHVKEDGTSETISNYTFDGNYVVFEADSFSPYVVTIKTYTVTFNPDNENESTTQTVEHGSLLEEPTTPEKEGNDFLGWYNGETEWNFESDTVTSELTLTAKWEEPDIPSGEKLFESGAQVIIAGVRSSGNYFFMSSDLGTGSTKRYQASDAGTTDASALTTNKTELIWTIEYSNNNNYLLKASNNQYVTWSSGNSGNLDATGQELNIVKNENGTYTITLVSDSTRKLQLNSDAKYNYFAFYTSAQVGELQIIVLSSGDSEPEEPVEKTDAEKVALDKETLSLPQTTTQDLDLPSLGANGSTITWTSNNEAITDEGVVTRGTSDVKVTLTATLKLKNETETISFEVTVLAKAEMSETGTFTLTSPAASANMSGSNQIASLNSEVDETKWSAIGNKKSASNNIGLYAEIRFYGKDGDGNELTISSSEYTIQTIKITFKSGYSAGAVVYVNGLKVEAVDGVYTINANEFIIKNENSGTTQVRITEIEITYSGGSSTN